MKENDAVYTHATKTFYCPVCEEILSRNIDPRSDTLFCDRCMDVFYTLDGIYCCKI